MYHTYILQLKNGSYYIGSTSNLANRMIAHSSGQVSSTKFKLPMKLLYTEEYEDRSQAQTREYQIKKWKKRAAIERLINKKNETK